MLWQRGWRFKPALRDFFIVALVVVVVMSPWSIRNALKYRQFIPVSNYGAYELYLGNNPLSVTDQFFYFAQPGYDPAEKARIEALPWAEQEKEYRKLAVNYILSHPLQFAQRTLAKAKNLFWEPVSPEIGRLYKMQGVFLDKWYLFLGLAGVLGSVIYLKKYSFLLLFTLYYSMMVSMITVVSGARYRLPVMPALILLGSALIVMVLKKVFGAPDSGKYNSGAYGGSTYRNSTYSGGKYSSGKYNSSTYSSSNYDSCTYSSIDYRGRRRV